MGHLSDYLTAHERVRGMAYEQFARLAGISKSTAFEILQGHSVPSVRTLEKISDGFGMPLQKLRELALLDTPFELPDGAELLDLDERRVVKEMVKQLLKSSGKEGRIPSAEAEPEAADTSNVVEMPRPPRVARAAYDPPAEE